MRIPPTFQHPVNERDIIPPNARSKTPFPVEKCLDKAALISKTTFTDEFLEELFISETHLGQFFESGLPKKAKKQRAKPRAPVADLGPFGRLPNEIAWMILTQLDLASLDNLRRVNRRARQLIISLPPLRRVAKLARQALEALIATELASHFFIADLETALWTETCPCGEFAPLVFLPHLRKACLGCLERPENGRLFRVWRLNAADRDALARPGALVPQDIQEPGHRIMHALAGAYGVKREVRGFKPRGEPRPFYVSGFFPPRRAVSAFAGGLPASYMAATTMPFIDRDAAGLSRVCVGVRCSGCDVMMDKVEPYSNDAELIEKLAGRRYSFDGYLNHFMWCKEAQRLWGTG